MLTGVFIAGSLGSSGLVEDTFRIPDRPRVQPSVPNPFQCPASVPEKQGRGIALRSSQFLLISALPAAERGGLMRPDVRNRSGGPS